MNRARPLAPAGEVDPDVFVNAWVGVRFRWDGRDMNGVDCWGLVMRYYRDCLAVELPDWTRGARPAGAVKDTFEAEVPRHWRPIAAPRSGCLVLVAPSRRPAHIGVFWRGGVLHAALGRGVVWENLAAFSRAYPSREFGEYVEAAE